MQWTTADKCFSFHMMYDFVNAHVIQKNYIFLE